MLNCKQGDLAIVVKSTMGNEGKIVRCLKLLEGGDAVETSIGGKVIFSDKDVNVGVSWIVDNFVAAASTELFGLVSIKAAPDIALRPIRDTDGQDEMLRIAGLPKNKELESV